MIPWNNNNNNNTISSSCPVEVAFSDSSSGSISGSIKGNRLVVPTSGQKGLNKKVCERILSFPGSSSSRFFNNNAASLFHSESPSSEEDGSTNFPCSFLHVYMYSWYRFVQLAKSCLHSTWALQFPGTFLYSHLSCICLFVKLSICHMIVCWSSSSISKCSYLFVNRSRKQFHGRRL